MAKRRRAPARTDLPQSIDEAQALHARYVEIEREAEAIGTQLADDLQQARARAAEAFAPLETEGKRIFGQLKAYFEVNKADLVVGERKTVDWPAGRLGWMMSSPAVKLVGKEAAVVAALKEQGLMGLIVTVQKVNKDAVQLAWKMGGKQPLPDTVPLRVEQREEFVVQVPQSQRPATEVLDGEDAQ